MKLTKQGVRDVDAVTIRYMLNGIIKRDCDAPPAPDHPYWQTPEGQAVRQKADDEAAARTRGDSKMLCLSDKGSIIYLEADREATKRLIEDGWLFDDATMAWAHEAIVAREAHEVVGTRRKP